MIFSPTEKANALLSLRCRVPAPPATVKIKLLQEYLRRKAHECNDGSHMPKELGTTTSLAEILAVAEKSGVEFIYAELVRFRKNDRYLELVGRLARRALDAALFDVAIKILVESFQWTHRRNAFVLHPERASESEKRSWRRKGYYVPKATVGIAPALSNRTSAVTAKRHPAKQARSNTMTVVDDDDNDDDVDDADGDMHAGKTERGTESTPSIDPMTEEEAKRVLQTKLPVVWRRARYRRRLRAILEDESIWRADILCTLGQCLREKAERVADGMDLLKTPSSSELNSESTFTKPSAFAVAFDWSWFQPGVTGTAVPRTVSSATTEQYESGQCEIDTLRIPDILQSYTQACVLSARYSNWIQLNNAARQLWNAHATISRFQVAHSKSYNEYLWRSMALASGALLDMLECAVVVQVTGHGVDRKEHILSAVEGPPTKECLEASAPWVVQSTRHLLRWVDRFGCKQQIDLDLDWVYRFVLLSIHLLGRSMNYERLLVVADRLNMVSHYAYGEFTLLQMLMALKETDRSELDIQAVKHMLMRVEKARVNARNELQKSRQRIVAALGYQAAKHLDSDRFHGSPLKGDGMASVVSAYKVTIEEATRFGDGVLVAKTLAELGDFYFNGGDCGSAGVFWKKSLEVFGKAGDSKGGLKVIDPLFARSAHEEAPKLTVADRFSVACLWGKLGCFNCHTDIDQRTAAFLKMSDELNGVASASLPGTQGFLRAMDEVDRLNSQFGGLDLISDKFTSNAGLIVLILLTASKELLRAGFTQKAFVTIGFAVGALVRLMYQRDENGSSQIITCYRIISFATIVRQRTILRALFYVVLRCLQSLVLLQMLLTVFAQCPPVAG